jgi:hypothetical protein
VRAKVLDIWSRKWIGRRIRRLSSPERDQSSLYTAPSDNNTRSDAVALRTDVPRRCRGAEHLGLRPARTPNGCIATGSSHRMLRSGGTCRVHGPLNVISQFNGPCARGSPCFLRLLQPPRANERSNQSTTPAACIEQSTGRREA